MNNKISIIIPAFNEEALLGATLASIRRAAEAFGEAGFDWELIVCDNNSTDRTAEIARAAGARVVFEPINQIGRARNAGAAAATGEWLVFVDADSHPSVGLFADVAAAIQSGQILAGGSTVAVEGAIGLVRMAIATWNAVSRLTRWAAGSFIFCRASAFRQLGGFNLRLYAAEEIDLFRRLKRLARAEGLGIRIVSQHPLLTSARKAHLHSPRELVAFQLKTILSGGRTLRSADGAALWYDGRR